MYQMAVLLGKIWYVYDLLAAVVPKALPESVKSRLLSQNSDDDSVM
jgi:hypothetical protein